MKIIFPKNAPNAVGPYSPALISDKFIFCSGQIGINPAEGKLGEGIENQTHRVMKNIQALLEAAESSMDEVIKTTIYLVDINDYAKVNEIYAQYFPNHKPARSTVAVSALPAGALVEIEVIAIKN